MKKITKNNKGFSLIELIIVIAIMAVLVAIIAPNLTKYLGKSKSSTDKKNIDEILTQVQTCISDYESSDDASGNPHGYIMNSGTIVLDWSSGSCVATPANTVTADLCALINSAITSSTKSKEVTQSAGNDIAYAKVTISLKASDPSDGYTLTGEIGKLTSANNKAVTR